MVSASFSFFLCVKASDLFAACLKNEGVSWVFGVPGEENLDLLESLREVGIPFITTRHEQGAGFMAATVGRLTGKAGVALSTLGPGATNLVTAAAYAQLGGMPAVFITGQKPVRRSKQGAFQIVDASHVLRPVTKHTESVSSGDRIPALVRNAFRLAEEERPGATHLELPEDIAAESTEAIPFFAEKVRRPVAEEKALRLACEMIQTARKPLLLVGAGANRKRTAKMLRAFIDNTHIPFLTTQMGKGVLDERDPLYLGTAALSTSDYVHCAVDAADLIINVGHDVVEKPPFLMRPDGPKVLHVNFFPAQFDAVYFPQREVIGDIANALWQITEQITVSKEWDFAYFLKVRAKIAERFAGVDTDDRFPMSPQRLVADVRAAVPDDGIVSLDNGMYKLWFARHYKAYQPSTLLLDNALATMGAGLSSAVAAKLVFPDRRVVAVCGDGGFLMGGQELETAVRLKLDLPILVLNDGAYGMIRWKQDAMGFPGHALSFGNPDFVKYAESFGAHGHRAQTAGDVKLFLERAFEEGGIHLIDVPIDYEDNRHVLTNELKYKSCPV